MRAYHSGVYSSYSSTLDAYTLPGAPILTATAVSDTAIDLSWTNPGGSALAETYTLEYTNGTDIQTGVSDFAHSDEALTQDTSYSYRVFTITNAGTGAVSSTATATTQTGPDPVAGDNLGWGNLGHATGNADNETTSNMNTMSGGTSEVSARDFFAGGCSTSLAGSGIVPFLGTETVSMVFDNVGSKFISRIAGRSDQFIWSTSNSNYVSVAAGSDYTAVITGHSVGQTATITCVWDANFNDTHDSISTSRTATINVTVTLVW
jgi:hypothetical protein